MKKNNFAVFILTHGRPDKQLTLETLRKQGYTGKIYLLVDDIDDTVEELRNNYENECDGIHKFHKELYYKNTDTVDNFHNLKSVVYARNASFDLAKHLDLDCFMTIDDDISQFNFRISKDNKLKAKKITNLDNVLEAHIDFFMNNNISALGFADNCLYFGGLKGQRYKERLTRECYQCVMYKTNEVIKYQGTLCEDLNTILSYGEKGKLFFTNMMISFNTPKRGTNKGGLQELYNENGLYIRSCYSLIVNPSKIRILHNGKTKNKLNNRLPKILNARWKK